MDRRCESAGRGPRPYSIEESPTTAADAEKKDPFEEIDFGSFFQDYLDPGYRSSREMEDIERPSFENFLSKPGSLTDHLVWQLGSISMRPEVQEAVELIIGNLNEDGYLIASDEELLGVAPPAPPELDAAVVENVFKEAAALGISSEPNLSAQGLPEPSASDMGASELDAAEFVSPEPVSSESFSTNPVIDSPAAINWNEAAHGVDLAGSAAAPATALEAAAAVQTRARPRLRIPSFSPALVSPISTKPSKSLGSSILPELPAVIFASAYSINCVTTSCSSNCTRTATENPPPRRLRTPSPSSISICAPCRTSSLRKSGAP